MYEVTFTEAFKDGLARLPKEVYPIISRQLSQLAIDPFAKNPNATRLKNAPCSFRAKIGIHVRMLYRVQSKVQRIIVQAIGTREHIYEHKQHTLAPLSSKEINEIKAEISGLPVVTPKEKSNRPTPPPAVNITDLPVVIEELPWVTEDELFLLQIPDATWAEILASGSVDSLEKISINRDIKSIVLDYLTNPSPNHVDKLYSLSQGQDATSITQQPLSHFLVTLDPAQKEALAKIKMAGPYLIKGSAGTGKSLVGLYHIRDLIKTRAGETLFDGGQLKYGIITYTNTLVDANRDLLQKITTASEFNQIECTTLDKIANELARCELGFMPSPLSTKGIASWLREIVLGTELSGALSMLGDIYIAEEIEQVIHGNGIRTLDEYISFKRDGRKRALKADERKVIWQIYLKFSERSKTRRAQTFEELRFLAIANLKTNTSYPRYAALFVDEAQDLSKVARQLCLELVQDPRYLLLAADTGQSLYMVPPSWKASDQRYNFNRCKPIKLERSYRSTKQIGQAISPLRVELDDGEGLSGNARPVFTGPKPQWIVEQMNNHPHTAALLVGNLVHNKIAPINPGLIAIVVREKDRADRYVLALGEQNIPASVVDKQHPLNSNQQVHIITAHSCKGLGFPVVIVPEVEASTYPYHHATRNAKDSQQLEQEQRLFYVALSRASHQLHMIVDQSAPSPFLDKLNRNDWR